MVWYQATECEEDREDDGCKMPLADGTWLLQELCNFEICSLFKRMMSQPLHKVKAFDSDIEQDARKVTDKYSEILNMIANEPSLGLFRIQQHVRNILPVLGLLKHEIEDLCVSVQGVCYDVDYASNAVTALTSSANHFKNIEDLMKRAILMRQDRLTRTNYNQLLHKYLSHLISIRKQDPEISIRTQDPEISTSTQDPEISIRKQDPEISIGYTNTEPGSRPIGYTNTEPGSRD